MHGGEQSAAQNTTRSSPSLTTCRSPGGLKVMVLPGPAAGDKHRPSTMSIHNGSNGSDYIRVLIKRKIGFVETVLITYT